MQWADATSAWRDDLLRDKSKSLTTSATEVTPLDVKAWQSELEASGLAPATVYAMIPAHLVDLARPSTQALPERERTGA